MSYFSSLPALADYFPPTPEAYRLLRGAYLIWPALGATMLLGPSTPMGKTSLKHIFNVNGRYAWALTELVGPLNLICVLYTLPSKLPALSTHDAISPSSGLFGTGLPITHEIMGLLYVLHYVNRALITPLFKAPSISPMLAPIALFMALHQFINSSSLGSWLCYDAQARAKSLSSDQNVDAALLSPLAVVGTILFFTGMAGNITAEWHLFDLRRQAAKRKAKAEGKAVVTYEKVYVVPEAKGLYKYVLFPHYSLEWMEWTGYWLMGAAYGLGIGLRSGALIFLLVEMSTMSPRAIDGLRWYENKFGKRAVAGRKAVIPGIL